MASATKTKSAPKGEKTVCPVTRKEFREHAKPLAVTIDGQMHGMAPKEFSTDSLGWHMTDKVTVMVNGTPVKCQANLMLTVIGSKELPKS